MRPVSKVIFIFLHPCSAVRFDKQVGQVGFNQFKFCQVSKTKEHRGKKIKGCFQWSDYKMDRKIYTEKVGKRTWMLHKACFISPSSL